MNPVTYKGSKHAYRGELDIFSISDTDVSIEGSKYVAFNSTNSVKDAENPIYFSVPKTQSYYDPGNSLLYVKAKIVKEDGKTNIDATQLCCPSSMFFHKMWKNIIVKVNNVLISDDQNQTAYRSVVPLLLSRSNFEMTKGIESVFNYRDSKYDEHDIATNGGFKKRINLSSSSKCFEMLGQLQTPLFTMNKYLPPDCSIDLMLVRNNPKFSLDAAGDDASKGNYVVSIEEITLYMKQFHVNANFVKHHQQLFSRGNRAQFPLKNVQVRSSQIGKGTQTYLSEVLWNTKMPNFSIFGLVTSTSYNGDLTLNPFNFKPYGLSTITLKCNEEAQLYRSLNMDYDSNLYQFAYQNLCDALQVQSTGSGISKSDFINGYCLYLFHLLPAAVSTEFQPERSGQLRVELQFKAPTTEPLQLISLGTFTNLLEIDSSGGVYIS